jgi:polyhydroxybutyrate depolymerase
MRSFSFALVPIALSLLVACSDDVAETTSASTSGAATTSAAVTGAGGTGGAATTGASTGAGGGQGGGSSTGSGAGPIGGDRPVDLFVPSSYDAATAMPLVLLLHGYTASGAIQESYFKLEALAEERGFLYAHPDGTKDGQDNRFWNATEACCNFYGSDVDDSAYLRGVIEDVKAQYNVDPKRVFLVGHSNGGFMSYRMACDHADAIAAIASLAGASFKDPADCQPTEPVAVLEIHGTADETVAYEGGTFLNAYPGAVETVEQWAAADACSVTPSAGPPRDIEGSIVGDETEVAVYGSGCTAGGHAELWTIPGGKHVPTLSADFAPSVIDFLLAHPKP